MERKQFLQKIGMATAAIPLAKLASAKASLSEDDLLPPSSCTVTNSETAGPYPSITKVSRNTITDSSGYTSGIPLTLTLTVTDTSCNLLSGAQVEIWHCNASGIYSEYVNGGNYTTYTFLRGYANTNSAGVITFTSIYPGWYIPRATHIHAIVTVSGTAVLTTQLAFPDAINTTVNTYYKNNGYSSGVYSGTNSTVNSTDQVFSDGTSTELLTVTGSTAAGYVATATLVANISALPLTLLSFNAGYDNKKTNLWWATANEVNSKGFGIERSTDAANFSTIGFVAANNNYTATSNYTFTDNSPLAGRNFYRLQIIDIDGNFTYSPVAIVNTSAAQAIGISPNPVTTNSFVLTHPTAVTGNNFKIISIDGRQCASGKLEAGSSSSTVDIGFLKPGIYLFVLESFADKYVAKFQKQ